MNDINGSNQTRAYLRAFGDPNTDQGVYRKDSRLAKAYEVALDIRKFEIELYWKRSGSFWLLVGGITAALGLVLNGKLETDSLFGIRGRELAACLLSLAGLTVSCAWHLVNKGSKFWQRNWEYQVDILEQEVLGPLYKTVFTRDNKSAMYSVSKINIFVSLYFCLIFGSMTLFFLFGQTFFQHLGLLLKSSFQHADPDLIFFFTKLILIIFNAVAIWYCTKQVRSIAGDKDHFDLKIKASVRYVAVDDPVIGSDAAKKKWHPPVRLETEGMAAKVKELFAK